MPQMSLWGWADLLHIILISKKSSTSSAGSCPRPGGLGQCLDLNHHSNACLAAHSWITCRLLPGSHWLQVCSLAPSHPCAEHEGGCASPAQDSAPCSASNTGQQQTLGRTSQKQGLSFPMAEPAGFLQRGARGRPEPGMAARPPGSVAS